MSNQAVWGLLARLYLNAAVYRDRYATSIAFNNADLDKVISYCDKLITGGDFALSSDYFALFGDDNHTNKELIFAVDQRADLPGSHNRLAYFSISGDMFPIATAPGANGTDGPAITPDFYHTWTDAYAVDPALADPRFYQKNLDPTVECISAANYRLDRGILRGQQYGVYKDAGAFVKCANGDYKIGKLYNWTRTGGSTLAVDFKEQVDFTPAGSNYDRGYRVEKYEFARKTINGRDIGDADIVILRLADIYLMRAEAKLRKNAGDATALDDVNTVRAARTTSRGAAVTPAPALTEMNLDLLFRERGFELYWEMVRRTDMIRFGKYEGTWTEKTDNNPQKRVFPIPSAIMDAVAATMPGYITQNPSY
jgi:starch-binding outer membrane protein, SusD/RagB family